MARRKVNTKFLVILAIPIVLLVGLVVAYKVLPKWFPQIKWIVRGTPAQHVEKAKQLFAAGDFKEAGEEYKRAISLKGSPDADMYCALGDCYARLVVEDDENLRYAVSCWNQAIQVNPQHVESLRRLLELYTDDIAMNRSRSGQQWQSVQDTAEKILRVLPKDHDARLNYYSAIIQRRLLGVEGNQDKVADAIGGLEQLSQEPPFDADVALSIWQSRFIDIQDKLKVGNRADANKAVDEVKQQVDAAIAAHPDDAVLQFRAAMMLRQLGFVDRQPNQLPRFADQVEQAVNKAASLVKPEQKEYVDILAMRGQILEGKGDIKGAEAAYRTVLEQHPTSIPIRILLSKLIGRDPARRDEAIKLLEDLPPPKTDEVIGLRASLNQRYKFAALSGALSLKLDSLGTATNKAEMDKRLEEIEQGYKKLLADLGEQPMTLQIKGRIEQARGDSVSAVQTYQKALDLLPSYSQIDPEQQVKIMYLLARANISVQQTARAEELLTAILKDVPKFHPARLELAQLLVARKAMDEARAQLDLLAKDLPDSPLVQRLQLAVLDKKKPEEKARIDAIYGKIPETNPQEMVEKAQVALTLENRADAARLLEAAYAAASQNPQLGAALARVYRDMGQTDKAQAILKELIARNPDATSLKVLEAEISGSGDVAALTREAIEKEPDPFRREMALYRLETSDGRPEEAAKHLAAAAALQPDNGTVQTIQFQNALTAGDFAKAEALAESLGKKNQDQADGAVFRIQLALAKGDVTGAEDLATQLIRNRAEFAQSWVLLGQIQMQMRPPKYAEAIQNFTQALARQAQNLDAILGLISCAYATNQTSMAKRYIDQGRTIFPNDPRLRELALNYDLKYGNPEDAIAPREQLLQQAIDRKSPTEAAARYQLGMTYLAVAKAKGNAGRPFLEKARDAFTRGVQQWPDDLNFADQLARTCTELRDFAQGEKVLLAVAGRDAWKGRPEPVLALSSFYAANNKPDQREKVLRDFLQTSPRAVPVQIQLATVLAEKRQTDEALAVTAVNADDPTIQKFRIDLQIDAGRFADAEKEVAALLATTPTPPPSLLNRQAQIYASSGRPSEALTVLDKVLAADPGNLEAMLLRSSINVQSARNLDRAIQDLAVVRDAVKDPKLITQTRLLLAQAHLFRNDTDGAMAELEAAVHDAPENLDARLSLARLYQSVQPPRWPQAERLFVDARDVPAIANDVNLLNEEALMWLKRKEPAKARDITRKLLARAGNNIGVLQTYVRALYDAKDYRPLLAETDAMAKSRKAPYWLYQYRGRALKALDEKPTALEEFNTALEVASASQDDAAAALVVSTIADEIGIGAAKARIAARAEQGDPRWRMMMAYLCQGEGDVSAAVQWMERVLADEGKLDPQTLSMARRLVGTMYLRLDPPDVAKAVQIYQKLIAQDPNDVSALNNLACTMILPNSGYTAKDALVYSKKALDILAQSGQSNPYIDDTHGYNLVLSGQINEGVVLIQQAIDHKPDFIEAYYHLGEAYLAMQNPQAADAEQALKQALTLLDKATRDEKPVDSALKSKIESALERCKQPPPA